MSSHGIEYEVYWTKCETDEDSPDAYIPGLTQNKFKPWQSGEKRLNLSKSKLRITSEKEKGSMEKKEKPSLKDLCPEDKTRIANLIRELAKTGREKDNAMNELESERKKYHLQEKESKEQLKLLAKERDTVKQHYVKCQQLLAQYQKELKQEQKKVSEAVQKAREHEKAALQEEQALEAAKEKAALQEKLVLQTAKENAALQEKLGLQAAQENAIFQEKQALEAAKEKVALQKEREQMEEKLVLEKKAQISAERDKLAMGDASHSSSLPNILNSRPHLNKLSEQSFIHQSGGQSGNLRTGVPLDIPFYPAMTSTNRSQQAGQFYPVVTTSKQPQQASYQNSQQKPSVYNNPHNHWSVSDVMDPRRSVEEFHALEAQVDDTPTFENELTPMSPAERQEYNDNAPQYRQNYIHMTPEQRWNELLLHREKLWQEQDWLRRKLHEQEKLLQQRKALKHSKQYHSAPVQDQEPDLRVSYSRPNSHFNPSRDNLPPTNRSIYDMRNQENIDKLVFNSPPRINRIPSGKNNLRDTIPSESNHRTFSFNGSEPHHRVRKQSETLLKSEVPSEQRQHSRSQSGVSGYMMENTRSLKEIVDTFEGTHISRFELPQGHQNTVLSQQNHLFHKDKVHPHQEIIQDPPIIQRHPFAEQDPPIIQRRPFAELDTPLIQQNPFVSQGQTISIKQLSQQDQPPIDHKIESSLDPLKIPSPKHFDIICDEEIDNIEESQILQDIFFLP